MNSLSYSNGHSWVGESSDCSRARFELELEFVQLFAVPRYCAFLVSEGYLSDPSFLGYMRYLRNYWSQPRYARFLIWPQCIAVIDDLLDDAGVRAALADSSFVAHADTEAHSKWLGGKE